VRSTQHHGISFPLSDVCTYGDEVAKLLAEQDDAVTQLQADGRVNDVVGGRTEVNAPSGLTSRFSHGLRQGHDVVSSFRLNFAHALFRDGFRVGDGRYGVVVRFRDPTELPVGPNEGAFNFELALVSAEFGPDAFEIFTAVPIIKWTKGHALRHTARFINLPTRVHEDGF
jgi:hypothetical protein